MNPIIKEFLDNGYIDEAGAERLMEKEASWGDLLKNIGTQILTTAVPTMGGVALGQMAYDYFGNKELEERDQKSMKEVAQSYHSMMSRYPELRKKEPVVNQRFQEIASLSPTVAKSPVVAKKIIDRTLNKGLDDNDMQRLLRLEVNSRQLQHRPIPKTIMGTMAQAALVDTGKGIQKALSGIGMPGGGMPGAGPSMAPGSMSNIDPELMKFDALDANGASGLTERSKNSIRLHKLLASKNALPSGVPANISNQQDFDNWSNFLYTKGESGELPAILAQSYEKAGIKSKDQLESQMGQYGAPEAEKTAAMLGMQYAMLKTAGKVDLGKTLLGLGAASLFGGAIGLAEEAADYARTKNLNAKNDTSWERTRNNLKRMTEEGNRLSAELDYTDRKTQAKAQETFNVLADVAPNIAANSTLATSFVNNVMLNEGQFTTDFVKALAETQKNITSVREYRSPFADSPVASGFTRGFGGAGGTDMIKSYATDIVKGD